MENNANYIGETLETFDGKNFIVKSQKELNDGSIIFTDNEGNIYDSEEDINWSYRLTAEYILFLTLEKNNIVKKLSWQPTLYKKILNDFMNDMVKSGYIEDKK